MGLIKTMLNVIRYATGRNRLNQRTLVLMAIPHLWLTGMSYFNLQPQIEIAVLFLPGEYSEHTGCNLSRAQRRDDSGNKGTIGLHIIPKSATGGVAVSQDYEMEPTGCRLGARRAQGLDNFRWLYMQYELKHKGWTEMRGGTCDVVSFVEDGTMFQTMRLTPGRLTKKGPGRYAQRVHDTQHIKFRVGGQVQFGCPCSNGAGQSSTKDFDMRSLKGGIQLIYNSKEYKNRLKIQVFVNGEQKVIIANERLSAGILEVKVSNDEPTIVISTSRGMLFWQRPSRSRARAGQSGHANIGQGRAIGDV